jgi:hypothetical protein
MCKVLRIPVEPNMPFVPQTETDEVKLQRFKNETGLKNEEAHYYLDMHDWDFFAALTDCKRDHHWEVHQQLLLRAQGEQLDTGVAVAYSTEQGVELTAAITTPLLGAPISYL